LIFKKLTTILLKKQNMDKIKKYFEFSGTISGTNYFLRNLLSSFVAFFAGYMIGYGIGGGQTGLTTLGLLIIAPTLWFSVTTIYKRANALFPENSNVWTVGILVLQILNQSFKGEPLGGILTLAVLIIGIIFIFSNSKIENHEG